MMLGFDPLYVMLLLPAMVLAMLASFFTHGTFKKYSHYSAVSGMTGAQAARRLLNSEGLYQVNIESSHGFLSDHYDPSSRTLRLSSEVFNSASLSSIGVACHEAGHAIQHAHAFAPLMLRTQLVPVTQIGSNLAVPLLMIGLLLSFPFLIKLGIILFSVAVLFTLVTLPVEWDASARAKRLMVTAGIVTTQEQDHASRVLNAAFLTYVAAAVTAILQLLYFLIRAGLLGRRDD